MTTLDRLRALVATHGAVAIDQLGPRTALHQDLRLAGADLTELVAALEDTYGEGVRCWPWHRFAALDEGLCLDPRRWSAPRERLELGHLAAVLERGAWFDP